MGDLLFQLMNHGTNTLRVSFTFLFSVDTCVCVFLAAPHTLPSVDGGTREAGVASVGAGQVDDGKVPSHHGCYW